MTYKYQRLIVSVANTNILEYDWYNRYLHQSIRILSFRIKFLNAKRFLMIGLRILYFQISVQGNENECLSIQLVQIIINRKMES